MSLPEQPPQADLIKITVDGHELLTQPGCTILQALTGAGIHLPALCKDVRLDRSNGNCGLCMVELGPDSHPVKACITPVADGMEIATQSEATLAYRRLRLEQLLTDHNADCVAPCEQTCPAHIDIQRYLALVADGNYEAAIRIIKDSNPFPSVCGQVCPHPCEAACRRNLVDTTVGINNVKRFAANWDLNRPKPWRPRKDQPTGKTVAVVGAGPSGLAAAYYLAQAGHQVTVYERQPQPGGMLRYGIPEYRLPKLRLDQEIATITALGVRILTDQALGVHLDLESLKQQYDAVYLAFGSWRATPLAMDGDGLDGVYLGIYFLEQITKGDRRTLGEEVVVVGGGNTAIDCARTALRLGAGQVKVVYRRTVEEMPAEPAEIAAALEEGIELVFLTAPERISQDSAGRKELHCLKMELGEPDRSGRRRPRPVAGANFVIKADTIIGAIGQSTNTQFLYNDLPVQLNKWGDIEIDGTTMLTSEEGIFAGGDCVTGPATVIQAVAAGAQAARAIGEYMVKGQITPAKESYNCSRGTLEDLPRHEFEARPTVARTKMPELELTARTGTFDQVELGLSEAEARAEADRCLHCGCAVRFDCELRTEATAQGVLFRPSRHDRPRLPIDRSHPFIIRDANKCISCGRCISACAELQGVDVLAYRFESGHLTVGTKTGLPLDQTDCVSCGQCVAVCPCGAMDHAKRRGDVFRAINDPEKLVVGFVAPAPRSIIAAEFNLDPVEASPFIAGLMRALGFDKAFDFSFAADLTIMEETTEFLNRVNSGGVMPQFTSCCPGWVNLVERRYPGLIPHLSSCKSPQQMMGATVKHHFGRLYNVKPEDLYVVSIVPCLAKQYEAARPEMAPDGIRDVDAVLTTQEFLSMIPMVRLDLSEVEPAEFDPPYSRVSGAGVIFGASGGVAEAALRMAVEQMTGQVLVDQLDFTEVRGVAGFKQAEVEAGGKTIRVAVISGLGHVDALARRVLAGEDVGYDLVEVMACPGGCVGGAGNPMPTTEGELAGRQEVLISIDRVSQYRKSQENPDVLRLYADFYEEPNSPLAHRLLHTTYHPVAPDGAP